MRVFPSDARFTAVSVEAMRINCLAHGYHILIQTGFEPSITVSKKTTSFQYDQYAWLLRLSAVYLAFLNH